MLVLQRSWGDRIFINDDIIIEVIEIKAGKVRLGFTAPESVRIDREEVKIRRDRDRATEQQEGEWL